MKWRDIGLKQKLIIPIASVGALMLLLSIMQVMSLTTLSENYARINEHYLPAIDKVLNADRDFYQAQIAERTLAMGSMSEGFVASHEENLQQVNDRVSALLSFDVDPDIKQQTRVFLSAFESYQKNTIKLVSQINGQSISTEQASELSLGKLNTDFEQLRGILDEIGEKLSKRAEQIQKTNQMEKQSALVSIGVMLLVAFLLVSALAVFFPRLIIEPINALSVELDELASGKGNLTHRMPRLGKDEIGRLSHNFNRFLSGLQDFMKQIQTAGKAVGEARSTLRQDSETSLNVSEEYAKAMDVVLASNHEMGLAIAEVADNTQQVSTQAKSSIATVQKVSKEFGRAREEIEALADNIDSASSVISELANETTNIASVLGVITGIAEQTNLLALNAAIEAARAGEQGRGFAVVADEVRTLASKTQQSTEDINVMIETLRSGADRAVSSMKGAQEKAGRTVEYSQDSVSQVESISGALQQITERISQIAHAVEEQATAIQEINGNLENTQTLSRQGQESALSMRQAVKSLNTQAEQLRSLIMHFQV